MTEIIADLPMPPSVNALWRRGKKGMVKSDKYVKWLEHADGEAMAKGLCRPGNRIAGEFTAMIMLQDSYRGDGDNRIKALLDWAQSRELITNDVYCRAGAWAWVGSELAPLGARMILKSVGHDEGS